MFEAYQSWQRQLERQPVLFLGRELNDLLRESRVDLGGYLKADPDDLVYIPNATHGVNIIAQSLDLKPGDEILTTDHEYGACDFTWDFVCRKAGAKYIHQPIPLPINSEEEIVDRFWLGVSPKTQVIYLSYITSPTALRLPVQQICQRAKYMGILTVIDAAHAPGQISIDLHELGADMVFGNCHKWMLAPKGSAFLFVRRELQSLIEPLIVSWGYGSNPEFSTGSRYIDMLQWTGTHDPAAALTVPAAIRFMQDHNWDTVRIQCHSLLGNVIERICDFVNKSPIYPLNSDLYNQMAVAPLPQSDLPILKRRLYDEYKIEVPLIQWQDQQFIRVSIQGYNSLEDIDALIHALQVLLPEVAV